MSFPQDMPASAGKVRGLQLVLVETEDQRRLWNTMLHDERPSQDFKVLDGYEPWLVETFVDKRLRGTCYQAANWTRIGSSGGRGRQDRERRHAAGAKELYVWVLVEDFRTRMPRPVPPARRPLPWDAGLEPETWVEQELGGAPLGDRRRTRRLIRSAAAMANSPMASFPGAVKGEKHVIKGPLSVHRPA